MDTRQIAEDIFRAGVNSVIPSELIPSRVKIRDNSLIITDHIFSLDLINDIYVIGAGKASAAMGTEIEKILGARIKTGHIVVKKGHSCRLKYIKVTEAGHPVPDKNGFDATRAILSLVSEASQDDLVICLISGGGSSLLADYPEGSSPEEMILLNDLLVRSGASISEINAVRKHVSGVKGGQLARAIYPATCISLILSDVPGNPLDVIASGPTVPDTTTFKDAFEVLLKYDLQRSVPQPVLKHLISGQEGLIAETPHSSDIIFKKTYNFLLGTNNVALDAAALKAFEYNINALIVDKELQGDVNTVAEYLVQAALQFKNDESEVKPVCLLFGGETTVKVKGGGKGGRNQHLALIASTLLKDYPGITILSGGTDGNDGTTDAAGAVVDSETYSRAMSKGIIPEEFISSFDSWHFFKKAGGLITTGPTMTNVMDIIVVLIQ